MVTVIDKSEINTLAGSGRHWIGLGPIGNRDLVHRHAKTPSICGIKHTAPYFHDNSARTLEEVAEQYSFMFRNFAGINLTPQDEADIVAFLKLL